MKYSELIQLGFKRIECYDSVWFNIYGYQYFFLELPIKENYLTVYWMPDNNHEIELNRLDENGNILNKKIFTDLLEFTIYIDFFIKSKTK